MSAPNAAPPPPDQLILTVTPASAYVEGTEGLPLTLHDPRDTEAVLATIGRWFLAARDRQGAANGGCPSGGSANGGHGQ